jgi:hypothetical protein
MHMKLEISLSPEAFKAMNKAADWVGQCTIHVVGGRSTSAARCESIANAAKAKDASIVYRLTPEEKSLLAAWNDSDYMQQRQAAEIRNLPHTPNDLPELLPLVRLTLRLISIEQLTDWLTQYFETCLKGEHVYDGRNHAFSSFAGFLRRMVDHHQNKTQPWWIKVAAVGPTLPDTHPKLTLAVADAYAHKFLRRSSFGLQNPSRNYRAFMRGADWVERLIESKRWPMTDDQIITALMDCIAAAQFDGGPVLPGHVCSDHTWTILMPQHLSQAGF